MPDGMQSVLCEILSGKDANNFVISIDHHEMAHSHGAVKPIEDVNIIRSKQRQEA
jgi:hypothetical protein